MIKKHLEEILIEEGSADRVNFSGGYVCGNARLNDDLRLTPIFTRPKTRVRTDILVRTIRVWLLKERTGTQSIY